MGNEIYVAIIGIAATVITHLLTKRKFNADADKTTIENLNDSFQIYKDIIEDNRKQLKDIIEERNYIRNELNEVRRELFSFAAMACSNLTCAKRIGYPKESMEELKNRILE